MNLRKKTVAEVRLHMCQCNVLIVRRDGGVGSWPRTEWVAYLPPKSMLNEVGELWCGKNDNDSSNPANDI